MGFPPETALAVPAATPAEWRRAVDAVATDARRTAAATFDADALAAAGPDRWRSILADTPLAGVDPHLPVDHPLYVMAATVALAERAVHLALAGEEHPLVLAAAVARLVESSLRDFTDPRTARTHRHLAGAKSAGAFFTPPDVALRMATAALAERPLTHRSVEPAGGTGMLTAALLVAAARLGRPVRSVEAWELSPYLARACAATLATVAERLGGGCQVRVAQVDALDRFAVAGSTARAGFDVVLLNPPYGRVKFLRSSLTNAETRARRLAAAERDARDRVQTMRARVARLATDLGLGRGTPDYQRLFIAGSYRLLSTGGRLVVIAPSAWTSGRDAADLREALFRRRALVDLTLYPEGCQLFPTVNQPTAIAVLDEAGGADGFQVTEVDPRTRTPRDSYRVGYDEVEGAGPNRWRVPLVPSPLRDAYRHLTGAPRFRDAAGARNARGELDLTLDAALVSVDATPVRLVRGDHVERFVLRGADESARAGYVTLDGLAEIHRRPKGADIDRPRVVGRQCSYLGKGRRLSFAAVPPGVVVGNSCNYVTTDDPDDVFAAVAILNSAVAEWWFRRRSSNNHVSNDEIDDLPWPWRDADVRAALRGTGRQLTAAYASTAFGDSKLGSPLEDVADALVCYGLALPPRQSRLVVDEVAAGRGARVAGIVGWLERHGVPASWTRAAALPLHTLPTLSALDLAMVRHVPQGGNWQQIPESVPSARLAQIRAMTAARGVVRTTYYGRLRPDQPAYTIATYYNRPGNGTNIHPHEDRTLTSREAARLQSFPDSYAFLGTDGAIRKQIGNAVPPLLGHAIGQQLRQAGCDGPVVDLFAGAGGLSLGLELAGLDVVAAVDNDRACEQTYSLNRPCESFADQGSESTLLVRADLADPVSRAAALASLRQKLGSRVVGAVVGGPPCQGFSHAGFRSDGDARNDLAVVFCDFVRRLEPRMVVLENVEGLLTYRKGAVVRELIETLRELGYAIGEPWLLPAECYGVPQMRRRVLLVGSRDGVIGPPVPLLARCRGRREQLDAVEGLPYPVTVAEALLGLPVLAPVSHPDRGRRPIRTAYQRWALGLTPTDEMLARLAR